MASYRSSTLRNDGYPEEDTGWFWLAWSGTPDALVEQQATEIIVIQFGVRPIIEDVKLLLRAQFQVRRFISATFSAGMG